MASLSAGELYDELGEKTHRDVIVMAVSEDGTMYTVKEVVLEPRSYDEGGNATSTGDTLWLKIEEY